MAKSRKSVKSADKSDKSAETSTEADKSLPEGEETAASESQQDTVADAAPETVAASDDVIEATAEEVSDNPEETSETEAEKVAATDGDTVEADAGTDSDDGARGDDSLLSDSTDGDIEDADKSSAAPWGDPEKVETESPEPEEQPQPEQTTEFPAPVAVAKPQPRRSVFWPLFFGGVIAALVGFIAGRGDQLDRFLPASMQRQVADLTALEAETAALEAEIVVLGAARAEQDARLATLEGAEPVEVDTSDLSDAIANLEASVAALADRLSAVEARPVATNDGASSDDLAAVEAALEAQRAELEALAARAAEAEANAASEAAKILARAALLRVETAVDSGATFTPALTELETVTPVEVPEALRAAAASGVPTMATLREQFPDAARAGLRAAREAQPESEVAGLTGFLKRQLGARSVTPREGEDTDAILSRAEAALRAGDLGTALSEMEALPDVAKDAMDGWLQSAAARKSAQDAADALSTSLNSN